MLSSFLKCSERGISMKFKVFKKLFFSVMCSVVIFMGLPQMHVSAAPAFHSGGDYYSLVKQPYDHKAYKCHYLIAKEALNEWAKHIYLKYGLEFINAFLIKDTNQQWAPSIIMEKSDYEKTLSYFDQRTRTLEQNIEASKYIAMQAKRIVEHGDIMGVLIDEINFIKKNFGHKYDQAIAQVILYIKSLHFQSRNRNITMLHPYHRNWLVSFLLR